MAKLSTSQIIRKIAGLKRGRSFSVASNSERKRALEAAKAQGKPVQTKKREAGGFVITAAA